MARVTLQGIGKRFGAERIIDNVDLDIADGEFLTLLGPSGCGKTTTLRIAAGFLSPDAGRVLFDGKDVTGVPTQHRRLGMVFQDYALFPHLTVADNIGFALRCHGSGQREIERRVSELLDLIRLPAMKDRFPSELSGGQQQRVAIARALAITPSVLLMDEPLGALDLKLREAMQDELHTIQRQLGLTTIYVTHDQEEALSLSHRVALMRRGHIEQLDEPKGIYSAPSSPYAAFFLGKVNFLQGHVTAMASDAFEVASAGTVIGCPVPRKGSPLRPGDHVTLGIRPEHLAIAEGHVPAGWNVLRGRIAREKFIGKVVQFEVETEGGSSVIVDGSLSQTKGIGAHVDLVWNAAVTHIYPFAEDAEIGIHSRPQRSGAVVPSHVEPAARSAASLAAA